MKFWGFKIKFNVTVINKIRKNGSFLIPLGYLRDLSPWGGGANLPPSIRSRLPIMQSPQKMGLRVGQDVICKRV